MPSHGFLAQTELSAESSPSRADFTLSASEATRASFPFAFDYRIRYELDGARLTFAIAIGNPGDEPLPVQFGLHPGFVVPGRGEAPAVVVFEADEAVELRALRRGQRAFHMPSPLEGRRLQLDPGLFAEGGMLFDPVRSSWLWHGVPGRPGMRVSFAGFNQLALWSKPPGEFLCIEPWHGAPDSEDFTGSLAERAHVRMLPPGGRLEGRCDIEFGVPEPR
jgi:galactose mutarotase-like enzyme